MTIAAILLAAGESTRMGRLKQLLPWDGPTVIAWQVAQLRSAGAHDVIVVLGHAADEIHPSVPAEAEVEVNSDYKQGRATSLRCGAEAVSSDSEAILILSVDQPRPAWLSRRLIERWRKRGALIVSPRYSNGYGHPILLDGSLLPELRRVDDATLGLRGLIDTHLDRAETVLIANDAVDVDLNRPSDYESALAAYQRGEWAEPVTP
jgi:molybdenum cofactor cytidylyltransferase